MQRNPIDGLNLIVIAAGFTATVVSTAYGFSGLHRVTPGIRLSITGFAGVPPT